MYLFATYHLACLLEKYEYWVLMSIRHWLYLNLIICRIKEIVRYIDFLHR